MTRKYTHSYRVLGNIFTPDAKVVKIVSQLCPIMALYQVFDGFQVSSSRSAWGVGRAGGKSFAFSPPRHLLRIDQTFCCRILARFRPSIYPRFFRLTPLPLRGLPASLCPLFDTTGCLRRCSSRDGATDACCIAQLGWLLGARAARRGAFGLLF